MTGLMAGIDMSKRVLFVEDEILIQELFKAALLRENPHWLIDEAASLGMALEKLRGDSYDAVILDIGLPDAVPEDVIQDVVGQVDAARIIVLSGSIYEDRSTYLTNGITSVISKNVSPSEAVRELSEIVNGEPEYTARTDLYQRSVNLTNTQKKVLHFLVNQTDFSIADIAEKMGRSTCTIKRHCQDVYRALDVKNRGELAAIFKG